MSTSMDPDMTVSEKLRAIAKAIMAEPEMYNQASYGNREDSALGKREDLAIYNLLDFFPDTGTGRCGTPGCVAGWAVALFGNRSIKYESPWSEEFFSDEFERYASELIFGRFHDSEGTDESDAVSRIFLPSWPDKWLDEGSDRIDLRGQFSYRWKPTTKQAASVLCKLADQIEREGGIQV